MKKIFAFLMVASLISAPLCFADAQGETTTKPNSMVLGSGGTTVSEMYTGTDTVANGQTSKATTITGLSTSARCAVSLSEVATNSIAVRAAVPTTNTLTVTVSGDPSASNADYTYICME